MTSGPVSRVEDVFFRPFGACGAILSNIYEWLISSGLCDGFTLG